MNESCWQVWLSAKSRIVSFHAVDGYQMQLFRCHDHFLRCMQELTASGFRFQ